ncbi:MULTISPECIES: FtsX-like permease family protein [unclassified Streptomyces]|uniref:FtsX-like permease family protein n=1 Tax=unclassified Streptomyces TaxID=2593676 RepID=UPI001371C49B|nr:MULTISPECIES: FtsX-like permease family protein [unclassified Streptomyces]MYY81013.1 FtsX-like permease family protein [Streptomyces sp. SID335]MYZ16966.1 FtsX-like permease family protein [Streptomyces sp. SID337]NDZ92276.1 FtsX-like permease family protein [Streptomyces sp. SID10115]NEB50614.1 FtsX-like permease family protein [Streptomyces sp. SID339]
MMLRYALQTVRDRKGGFVGAFLALMCAAALVTACGTLLETGLRGTIKTERYAAAPVIVSGDQNVHQTTVKHKKGKTKVKHKAKPIAERAWLRADDIESRIKSATGVATVVPELTFLAQPVIPKAGKGAGPDGGADAPTYGHAWKSATLTPFHLVDGKVPRSSHDLVIDRGLADRTGLRPGDRLTVQSTQSPRDYRITGVAAAQHGALTHQTSLFFSSEEAERLAAHPGKVTAFGVVPAKGTSVADLKTAVEQAVEGTTAQISTGDDRGPVEFLDAAGARVKLVSMGGAMGGTSLLVAVLVVVGTFALSIQQRHRELALLRAVAATPKQIRRLLGREALVVGAVAGAVGALAGLPLGEWLHERFVATGAVPATLERTVSVFPPLVAVGATLLGAWAAARIAGRRIVRIRPAQALAEAQVEPGRPAWSRIVAGLVLLVGGVVLVAVLSVLHTEAASTPVTFLTVVVFACAIALLGPFAVRAAATLLRGPLRLTGPGGKLAHANLRGNAARMAAVVTPLALLTGMACTVLFVQPTLDDAARAQAREGIRADWVLAAQGPGVPAQAARKLRTTDGVEAATEVVRTTVRVGLDKYSAQGVTPEDLARTWDPDVTAGTIEGFGERSVAVSELAADRLGLKPGSTLKFTLGDGTRTELTVRAVYARGLGFGDLTMAHDLVARHVDNPLATTVLVRSDRTQQQLAAALDKFPGVHVLTPSAADDLQAESRRTNAEVNLLAMGLVLAFTAIAVVNTLAMSVSERIREFAMLRLAGATRRQVLRMLRTEALAVLFIGTGLGSGVALAVLTAFSVGMTGSAAPTVVPLVYVSVLTVAGLLALTATALPGRAALRPLPVAVATAKE